MPSSIHSFTRDAGLAVSGSELWLCPLRVISWHYDSPHRHPGNIISISGVFADDSEAEKHTVDPSFLSKSIERRFALQMVNALAREPAITQA